MIAIMVLSGIATGVGYLSGGSSGGATNNNSSKSSSKVDPDSFVDEITEMVDSGYRPTEIEPRIKENIEDLDKDSSTKVVREFMTSINSVSNYFGQLLYFMGAELEYTKEVDNIEDLIKNADKISNNIAKGFLKEAERQYLIIKSLNGYYYIEPDAKYVLDEYGSYIHGVYKEYLNLAVKQQTDPIFDEEKEMYNVSRLKEDLESIELSRDRWSESDYAEDFTGMEQMLYEALFGVSHTTFFDLEIKNEGEENEEYIYTLKDEIREEFESLILENNETPLTKEMEEYLNILKKNKYKLNDEANEYVEKLLDKKFNVIDEANEQLVDDEIMLDSK